MTKTIDIIKSQQTNTPGRWKEITAWRIQNRNWLKYSQRIALAVLNRMDELSMTQKALAERMGCSQQYISTLVKGKENLTLETISKLETVLDFDIIGKALVGTYCIPDNPPCYLSEPDCPYGNKND